MSATFIYSYIHFILNYQTMATAEKRKKCLKVHKMIRGVISKVKISCMGNTMAVISMFWEDTWCGCVPEEVVGLPCEERE